MTVTATSAARSASARLTASQAAIGVCALAGG